MDYKFKTFKYTFKQQSDEHLIENEKLSRMKGEIEKKVDNIIVDVINTLEHPFYIHIPVTFDGSIDTSILIPLLNKYKCNLFIKSTIDETKVYIKKKKYTNFKNGLFDYILYCIILLSFCSITYMSFIYYINNKNHFF